MDRRTSEFQKLCWDFSLKDVQQVNVPSKEELEQTIYMFKLISYWKAWFYKSQNGEGTKDKLESILEAMKKVLSSTFDMWKLSLYWIHTSYQTREIVQKRMEEVLALVSPQNIPKWFRNMVEYPYLVPECISSQFKKKAREMYIGLG